MKTYCSDILDELTTIVLISHGYLAKELLNSAKLIAGEINNIAYACLEEGDNPEEFKEELKGLIDSIPTKKLLLVDLFGGTPCNSYISIINEIKDKSNAISGMNLPMLLEVITSRSFTDCSGLANIAENSGRESVCNINERLIKIKF